MGNVVNHVLNDELEGLESMVRQLRKTIASGEWAVRYIVLQFTSVALSDCAGFPHSLLLRRLL